MPIKVAIDSGPLSTGHAIRGIGVMVKEEIQAIEKIGDKSVKFEAFDFSSEEGRLKLQTGNYDIVHYTIFFPYALTVPEKKYGKKVLITIQDLIHLIYPDKYPPGLRGKLNLWIQKKRLKNVDHIITISETSKKDIVRLLNIPQEKIHVVYLAHKDIFKKLDKTNRNLKNVKEKYNLPSKFALFVGDINYNKNIPNLIEACKLSGLPLVIAGKKAKEIDENYLSSLTNLTGPRDYTRFILGIPHPELAHYERILNYFKNKDQVLRLGFVPDEDIVELYNLATVYIQPSYYEGFGLPILEAMASGTPVVVSRSNCLTEISGDSALIADPDDPKDLAKKIMEIKKDTKTRNELVKKGLERVKDFSWQKTAKAILQVYKTALK